MQDQSHSQAFTSANPNPTLELIPLSQPPSLLQPLPSPSSLVTPPISQPNPTFSNNKPHTVHVSPLILLNQIILSSSLSTVSRDPPAPQAPGGAGTDSDGGEVLTNPYIYSLLIRQLPQAAKIEPFAGPQGEGESRRRKRSLEARTGTARSDFRLAHHQLGLA